jgi:hypothetical protein
MHRDCANQRTHNTTCIINIINKLLDRYAYQLQRQQHNNNDNEEDETMRMRDWQELVA